jgi:hypothetical protein
MLALPAKVDRRRAAGREGPVMAGTAISRPYREAAYRPDDSTAQSIVSTLKPGTWPDERTTR